MIFLQTSPLILLRLLNRLWSGFFSIRCIISATISLSVGRLASGGSSSSGNVERHDVLQNLLRSPLDECKRGLVAGNDSTHSASARFHLESFAGKNNLRITPEGSRTVHDHNGAISFPKEPEDRPPPLRFHQLLEGSWNPHVYIAHNLTFFVFS